MTKLSPAAQAVAKAALKASSFCKDETCPYKSEEVAAAVLRAVAQQGATFYWDGCPVQAVTVGSLLTIADQLEAS